MKMKAKGYRKGGVPSKGAVSDKEFEKFEKARGKAMGGMMKAKGMKKGGKVAGTARPSATSGFRAPSSKSSGLYGK